MAAVLEFETMTLQDKLRTMEALWDALCQREQDVPVPQWQKDILEERERAVAQGAGKFVEWETAKKEIVAKLS
jgi:Putative addiction module component